MSVAFDDNIPKKGPELFIKRLKAGEDFECCSIGTRIRGIWVHWNPKTNKSEPHLEADCSGCVQQMPKRWKGFLHVYQEAKGGGEMFLELTPASAATLMDCLESESLLRGATFRVSRGGKQNSRLNIKLNFHRRDPAILPKERDPRISILKLWGLGSEGVNLDLNGTPHQDGEIEGEN